MGASHLIEIHADDTYCKILQDYFDAYDGQEDCQTVPDNEQDGICVSYNGKKTVFEAPVRLGDLMDRVAFLRKNTYEDDRISFGNGAVLEVYSGHFRHGNVQTSLTEKEVAVLVYLNQHKDRCITRDELLQVVWQYAEGVETHTLETHIYRLRQKIEDDPSCPSTLITDGNGYRLGV